MISDETCALFRHLREDGLSFRIAEDGRLTVSPASKLTDEQREVIWNARAELVALLQDVAAREEAGRQAWAAVVADVEAWNAKVWERWSRATLVWRRRPSKRRKK